jgi:hypothetical protein
LQRSNGGKRDKAGIKREFGVNWRRQLERGFSHNTVALGMGEFFGAAECPVFADIVEEVRGNQSFPALERWTRLKGGRFADRGFE